jgi:long-chain acyl-CoA synthetase
MNPVWLQEYPPGVPPDITVGETDTLASLLEGACTRYGDQPAFTSFGHSISFRELNELTARFATWLQSLEGVQPGDRVAIMLPNLLQYPVALFGTWRAGMVVVNVNPLYTPRELAHQLEDSGASVLLIVDHRAAVYQEIAASVGVRHVMVTGIGDMLGPFKGSWINFAVKYLKRLGPRWQLPAAHGWREVRAQHLSDFRAPEGMTSNDLACLQYTGGTTGRSKGAMLTHRNLVANVRQMNAWFASKHRPGEEIVITPLPLYHVYALTCNCLSYVDVGANDVLITDPRDTRALIAEMRRWRFTAMTGVNTLYQSLANHPDITTVDFSTLRLVSAGGMAVLEATARAWAEKTGTPIHEGYGLSETSPVVTTNPATLTSYNGSIGLPLPGTLVSLRDADGKEVPPGQAGELCVKGPQVMQGYWEAPDLTAAAFTADGFFRTGDVATVDAKGYFRIVDRMKDMIDVSGLKVFPNEVEGAAARHPAVLESACIGVEDPRTGEAVKIFVVKKPGADLSVESLREFLRTELAPYKVPRHVEFRDSLPKSPVGKILRRELREPR